MIGGGDGDRVYVLVCKDAAHVGFELRAPARLLKDGGGGFFGAPAVDVDKSGDFHVGKGQNLADVAGAAGADAYNGDADPIVSAGPRLGRGSGGGDQKMSAVHIA
jgi:hypothetical protein